MESFTPTRANLIRVKEALSLAKEGHSLLQQKREVLIMELMHYLSDLREIKEEIQDIFSNIYELMEEIYLENGRLYLTHNVLFAKPEFEVEIKKKSIMGVVIPFIEGINIPEEAFGSSLSGSSTIDEIVLKTKRLMNILLDYFHIGISVIKLTEEIVKTMKRENALEKIFIPWYEAQKNSIISSLEEMEREEFFRTKLVKKRLMNEQI